MNLPLLKNLQYILQRKIPKSKENIREIVVTFLTNMEMGGSVDFGLLQLPADLSQGRVLSLLLQQQQPPAQQGGGLLVDPEAAFGSDKIVIGRGVGIGIPLIDPAGGNAVANISATYFFGILHPPMDTVPSGAIR